MDRVVVKSNQIKSIGFETSYYEEDFLEGKPEDIGTSEVEFKPGSIYQYKNFPRDLYTRWLAAESKGKFFAEFIKPFPEKFPFRKTRGTDKEEANKLSAAIDAVEIPYSDGAPRVRRPG